jgi:hypothetical protein
MPAYAYDRLSVADNSPLAIEAANTYLHAGAVALFEAGPVTTGHGAAI